MRHYLLTRLLHSLLVLVVVATATFILLRVAPGGPSVLVNPALTPEDAEELKRQLGLDQPIFIQYGRWLLDVAHFDLGASFLSGRTVGTVIGERLAATVLLSATSLLIALAVALPLGALAAKFERTWIDYLSSIITMIGISIPSFWLGILLILGFAVTLRVLPAGGMTTAGRPLEVPDLLAHLAMPALVHGLLTMAQIAKYTRTSLLGVLRQDFIRTARSKGLRERTVLVRHAFRNALVPVVTVVGVLLPRLVGGAVVTETIFAWPGIGQLALTAAFQRDYPVVMGVTMMISVVVVVSNLAVDLMYVYLDPRIRLD